MDNLLKSQAFNDVIAEMGQTWQSKTPYIRFAISVEPNKVFE
jgi:hypothetical protein